VASSNNGVRTSACGAAQAVAVDSRPRAIQPSVVEEIEAVIMRLNRVERLTVILVEQSVEFARRAAQRFAIMEKGASSPPAISAT